MDWYEITGQFHERTFPADGDLAVLPREWQRELAAIWRLEADVNNGTYLQFIENWGGASYEYAVQGLRKMKAKKMARIVEKCHKIVLDNTDPRLDDADRFRDLMPNPTINDDGSQTNPPPSPIPEKRLTKIYDLSYKFMDYPDDIEMLGCAYYAPLVDGDAG